MPPRLFVLAASYKLAVRCSPTVGRMFLKTAQDVSKNHNWHSRTFGIDKDTIASTDTTSDTPCVDPGAVSTATITDIFLVDIEGRYQQAMKPIDVLKT